MRVRARDCWRVASFWLTNAALLDRYIKQGGPLNVQALEHRAKECGDSSLAAGAGVASTGEGHRGVSIFCISSLKSAQYLYAHRPRNHDENVGKVD